MCSTFRTNLRGGASLELSKIKSIFLTRQLQGYRIDDPATTHQMALPIVVFKKMWRNNKLHMNMALGQLTVGAFFWGMRSCEYSTVLGERKTKILRLRNISFFIRQKEVSKTGRFSQ
jgi:hypothetical protein